MSLAKLLLLLRLGQPPLSSKSQRLEAAEHCTLGSDCAAAAAHCCRAGVAARRRMSSVCAADLMTSIYSSCLSMCGSAPSLCTSGTTRTIAFNPGCPHSGAMRSGRDTCYAEPWHLRLSLGHALPQPRPTAPRHPAAQDSELLTHEGRHCARLASPAELAELLELRHSLFLPVAAGTWPCSRPRDESCTRTSTT